MDTWTQQPLARFITDQFRADYDAYDEPMKLAIREIGVRNMLIEQRLYTLLTKLHEKQIQPIVMKGCHLIHAVYPFGVRPVEDIDIVLDRKHFAAANKILNDLGYEQHATSMDIWTHIEVSNKLTYWNQSPPLIPIDIHYTLGPYPYLGRIPLQALFDHSEPLSTDKISYLVLKPEMLLVHLCLHLFQHHDEHWQVSASDLSTLTTLWEHNIDWERFIHIVETYSLQLPVHYSLKKAAQFAAIHIPVNRLEAIASLPSSRKELRIFQASLIASEGMEKYIIQFMTLPGMIRKLKCLKRIAFPSKVFLRKYYNGNYLKYLTDISLRAIRTLRRHPSADQQ